MRTALVDAGRVVAAEWLKQHRRVNGSVLVVCSMLLWPVLELAATFYTVKPVATEEAATRWPALASPADLFVFLVIGALAFTFFYSLVQSAWHFSFERQTGTIELLFLAPVDRLVLVVANGAGSLVQNTWLFTCFTAALLALTDVVHVAHPGMWLVIFGALLVPAVAWGALLNSVLLFSRDASFLYTLFGDPMALACGVRLPVSALPAAIGALATLLPLTGSLAVLRGALLDGDGVVALLPELAGLAALSVALLAAASVVLRVGERRVQRSGTLRMF